ncbi:MAG TPA: CPBP family intramembrane metalloprotease [Hyphomicrobium zavarzinii]|jgi:membrane protease YdiL (CAAX protease family)|uniref:CPBP family intramembrane glutamic endopeptidase n=1 Tax=Hyphomicrobium sp. DMF-1 TaxID=3019544 RepID=UPI0022EC0E62|nr:CPBP family intramembrane glutamic endopeptidase [Hyphomicrobium sp. DMF-1]WBT36494.1 CPBP family intramembrane metalloprotease [Hyphomicrobium sp. DMF-1]HML42259.1 CPBP family intramembrane metalloprotease [Hyphomicrobium zavarzinii]
MITAGGSTTSAHEVSLLARLWRWIEMALLFGAAPIVMSWVVHGERVPLLSEYIPAGTKIPIFIALLPVLFIAAFLLLADPTFRLRDELRRGLGWRNALSIVLIFLIMGGAATWWIKTYHPSWFLEFPTNRPETYTRIMLAYPVFSVAAQELLYRSFFFHRYGPLFGTHAWLIVIVNGLLFGYAHIVMNSAFAIAATALGGMILAARYAMSRSFWAVFIEHTLWGWLIFTIGLGRYFFTGVQNP